MNINILIYCTIPFISHLECLQTITIDRKVEQSSIMYLKYVFVFSDTDEIPVSILRWI